MTRKELYGACAVYFRLLETKNIFESEVNEPKKISNDQIGRMVLSRVASETQESSNIWCCLGTIKGKDENDRIELYYKLLDLETVEPKFISILEYGDFCRNNSVILLDEFLKTYSFTVSDNIEGYTRLRNLFLDDLAKKVFNLNSNKVSLEDLGNHYDKVIAYYKKIGKETITSFKGHNR